MGLQTDMMDVFSFLKGLKLHFLFFQTLQKRSNSCSLVFGKHDRHVLASRRATEARQKADSLSGNTFYTNNPRGLNPQHMTGCGSCAYWYLVVSKQVATHPPVLHILPDRFNDPGALHSHRDRRGGQRLVQPLSAHQLGEVKPTRLDAHQDLCGLQLHLALRLHLQLDLVVAPVPCQDQSPAGEGVPLGYRAAP